MCSLSTDRHPWLKYVFVLLWSCKRTQSTIIEQCQVSITLTIQVKFNHFLSSSIWSEAYFCRHQKGDRIQALMQCAMKAISHWDNCGFSLADKVCLQTTYIIALSSLVMIVFIVSSGIFPFTLIHLFSSTILVNQDLSLICPSNLAQTAHHCVGLFLVNGIHTMFILLNDTDKITICQKRIFGLQFIVGGHFKIICNLCSTWCNVGKATSCGSFVKTWFKDGTQTS